jgi:hypothetical protein
LLRLLQKLDLLLLMCGGHVGLLMQGVLLGVMLGVQQFCSCTF